VELAVTSAVDYPVNGVSDTPRERPGVLPSPADQPAPKAANTSLEEEPRAVRRWLEAVDLLLWMLAILLAVR
jgi:hypothetical protein